MNDKSLKPTPGSTMSHPINHYTFACDTFKVGQTVGLWEDETWYPNGFINGCPFHREGHLGVITKKDTVYVDNYY